eukprot:2789566-Prymnesium_polylepis.1
MPARRMSRSASKRSAKAALSACGSRDAVDHSKMVGSGKLTRSAMRTNVASPAYCSSSASWLHSETTAAPADRSFERRKASTGHHRASAGSRLHEFCS